MRSLVLSLFSILLITSCTDQEKIAQYEAQLKESNEALEGIINYRISYFNMMAAENPEKAGPWAKKAHAYFEVCQNALKNWPLNKSQVDYFSSSLDQLKGSDLPNNECLTLDLNIDIPSFEAFRNQIQLNLNCYLKELAYNISVCDLWWISYVKPVRVKMKDSTLIILEGVLTQHLPKYTVSIDQPFQIDINASTSLARFVIPNKYEDSIITGRIELFDNYSPNVEYFSFKVDTNKPNSQIQFHTPTTQVSQKNP